MTAALYPLVVEQGATLRFTLTFTHPELDVDGNVVLDVDGNPKPGVPYDFTGATAQLDVRLKVASPTPVFTLTSNPVVGITLGDAAGTVAVEMSADQTELLGLPSTPRAITEAVYDLEVTYPSGDRDRLIEGSITVKPSVTRSNDDG